VKTQIIPAKPIAQAIKTQRYRYNSAAGFGFIDFLLRLVIFAYPPQMPFIILLIYIVY